MTVTKDFLSEFFQNFNKCIFLMCGKTLLNTTRLKKLADKTPSTHFTITELLFCTQPEQTMVYRLTPAPIGWLHLLTCDPADFIVCEAASDPSHMCSQAVTQQMDPFPGQVQLILKGRKSKAWKGARLYEGSESKPSLGVPAVPALCLSFTAK